ncbi:MAG: hypothetical protein Q9178_000687 [Gyalolechia marmorata]
MPEVLVTKPLASKQQDRVHDTRPKRPNAFVSRAPKNTSDLEDVAAFEDSRTAKVQGTAENVRTSKDTQASDPDPNDELRPLPGDKVRAMRAGLSRDERIGVSR